MSLGWKRPDGERIMDLPPGTPEELRGWLLSLPQKDVDAIRQGGGQVGQQFSTAAYHEFVGQFGRIPEHKPFEGK